MEYRIVATSQFTQGQLTQLILNWYHPTRSSALPPTLGAGELGARSPFLRPQPHTPPRPGAVAEAPLFGSMRPSTIQPAASQTATEFMLAPGLRLQYRSRLGGLTHDLFTWQENHLLVVSRHDGHYRWQVLRNGWETPPFYDAPPANLGAFSARLLPPLVTPVLDVSRMTKAEKLTEAIKRSADSSRIAPHLRQAILDLISPESIGIMLAFGAAYAASLYFGVGEIATVVFLGVGVVLMGQELITILDLLYKFYDTAVNARTSQALDRAADLFAQAVVKGGIDIIIALLTKKAAGGKARSGAQRQIIEVKPAGGGGKLPPVAAVAEEVALPPKTKPAPRQTPKSNSGTANSKHPNANATSGNNSAAKKGKKAHKDFADKIKKKPGWQSEPTIIGKDGKKYKPDAITPSGHIIELKPNTPRGRSRGKAQLKKYEKQTGRKGRVVYY